MGPPPRRPSARYPHEALEILSQEILAQGSSAWGTAISGTTRGGRPRFSSFFGENVSRRWRFGPLVHGTPIPGDYTRRSSKIFPVFWGKCSPQKKKKKKKKKS